jgi:hypothetical protein
MALASLDRGAELAAVGPGDIEQKGRIAPHV